MHKLMFIAFFALFIPVLANAQETQSVTIEFLSTQTPLEMFLRQGSSTLEDEITLTDDVGIWTGMLEEGVWQGTVKGRSPAIERTFTIEVGSQPVVMRVFIEPNPEADVDVETGCACTSANTSDASIFIFPGFLLALFTRRRWVSSKR